MPYPFLVARGVIKIECCPRQWVCPGTKVGSIFQRSESATIIRTIPHCTTSGISCTTLIPAASSIVGFVIMSGADLRTFLLGGLVGTALGQAPHNQGERESPGTGDECVDHGRSVSLVCHHAVDHAARSAGVERHSLATAEDRKSTRLNSSH